MELTVLMGMELAQLSELKKNVELALQAKQNLAKAAARDEIFALAKSVGLTPQELLKDSAPGAKKPVSVRYRNPADASQTWTGRGRSPKWVLDSRAAGTLDAALVSAAPAA
jgi:DNA-binding protein H-NS